MIDPELHAHSGHQSTSGDLYAPFHTAKPRERCIFLTGGERAALPGVACLLQRLARVQTRHPVIVAVAAQDAAHAQPLVVRHGATLAHAEAFPTPSGTTARAFDRLNALGALSLARRVVWLSPNVRVRRNVDALCALPTNVSLYAPARARRCFDDELGRSSARLCATSAERRVELESSVLVVTPLDAVAFNQEVVAPVVGGAVGGIGGGRRVDALLNELIYRRGLFGGGVASLPEHLASAWNRTSSREAGSVACH